MKKVTLNIENFNQSMSVKLNEELSIGRGAQAQIVLDDEGLSRVNTTIFRDDDEILIVDENSTNGTFINGEQISGPPRRLHDQDEITIGNNTRIYVEIRDEQEIGYVPMSTVAEPSKPKASKSKPSSSPKSAQKKPVQPKPAQPNQLQLILLGSIVFAVLVITVAVIALIMANRNTPTTPGNTSNNTPALPPRSDLVIPIRVIDPLGGEDPDDVDDLIASWEVEEKEINPDDLSAINATTTTDGKKASDLNVSIDFYKAQLDKALNHGATGATEPGGMDPLPPELVGGNVSKQKNKLAEMISMGIYKQPMDFGDLAQLRLDGKLVEMPMATNSYVLDVGGSASGDPFTSFDWDASGTVKIAPIVPGTPKYDSLKKLADNFDGQKYDLDNPNDRKQMRIRLLRMYNSGSRKVFETITDAYFNEFKVPLRVTSLTRSMDYQIGLNKTNSNSFKVSGKGSLPPHTSGCAFDMSRKNLTVKEQNFMMKLLASLESAHKLDSLREGNANACFHTFIFYDGKEAAAK